MSEEKFQDASALEDWLKGKDVDPEKGSAACQALFDKGYDLPSTLIGISFEALTRAGIRNAVARHLTNKLKEQQPTGEFQDASALEAWLKGKGVDEDNGAEAAKKSF